MPNTAQRLKTLMEDLLQAPLPIRLRAWDGSESGPPDTPRTDHPATAGRCAG